MVKVNLVVAAYTVWVQLGVIEALLAAPRYECAPWQASRGGEGKQGQSGKLVTVTLVNLSNPP
jgi:hypothetical protein